MKQHTEVYKMEWNIERCPSIADDELINCPERLFAFRVYDMTTYLKVTVIITENEAFNELRKSTLYRYIKIAQDALFLGIEPPEWICSKPLNNVIAYEQSGAHVLTKFYEPLIYALAKDAHQLFERWFTYNDLVQQCYVTLISLRNQGYYCSKGLIKKSYYNDLFVMARKLPTKWLVLSFDEPVENSQSDDTVVKIIDTLADEEDKYEPILDNLDLINKRNKIISIIGQRQYDQLLREFRTHTVAGSTAVKINKLKKRLKNEK